LEIIIVDDKSTDDTVQKVSKLAKLDSRIKIITKQKEGPAIARLTGLKTAKGKCLFFLDSDDLLFPGTSKSMTRIAEEEDGDCVFSDFIASYGNKLPHLKEMGFVDCAQRYRKFRDKYTESDLAFQGINFTELASSTYTMVIWGKLIRKSKIPIESHESLPPYAFGEDFLFNHLLHSSTTKISFWEGTSIMHRLHSSSLTAKRSKNSLDFAKSAKNALEMYKQLNLSGKTKTMDLFVTWVCSHLVNCTPLTSIPAYISDIRRINPRGTFRRLISTILILIIQKLKPTPILVKVLPLYY
jgi:glycosyltransferase involved in cell wall biosynthesis